MKRIAIAVSLGLPGIALAMAAKPLNIGGDAMTVGLFLAFSAPVAWLVTRPA
jgi:hypothetical protein